MGYKPDPIQKAKFESPLGELFNRELDSGEKQVGLLKRLKNIENKTDNQLRAIKDIKSRRGQIVFTDRNDLEKFFKTTSTLVANDNFLKNITALSLYNL